MRARSPTARAALLAAPPALLALAWLFRGLLAGGRLLQADFHQFFEPMRSAFAAAAAQGQVGWSELLGNGSPLIGNPLHAAAYPPNLACLLGEPAFVLSLLCALHLAWGAAGAWLLARERGASAPAAWTAGAAFALSGVALSSLVIPNLGWPLAWLPWLLVAHGRLRRRPLRPGRRRRATGPVLALAACFAMLLVLAEPCIAGAALLWIALAELAPLLRSRGRRRPWRAAAALALGAALALPLVWPALRYLPHSVRAAGFKASGLLQWSLHPVETLAFVAPQLFGDPALYGLEGYWPRMLSPERGHPFFPSTYLGVLVVALAVAGASTRGRKRGRIVAWLALMALLALGGHGPVFPLLLDLPGVGAWRYPSKWLAPMTLGIALLAARGVDGWDRRHVRRVLAVAGGTLTLLAAAWALLPDRGLSAIAWKLLGPEGPEPGWLAAQLAFAGRAALWPLLAAAVLLLWRTPERSEGWKRPLLAASEGQVLTVPADWYRRVPPAAAELLREDPPVQRLFVEPARRLSWRAVPLTREAYFRWERDVLRLDTPVSFGLPLALQADIDAMAPLDYAALGVLVAAAPEREQLMLLGAAGVTHLAGFRERDERRAEPMSVHASLTAQPLRLYRNRLAQPRVRVVRELMPYAGPGELLAVLARAPDELFAGAALVAKGDAPVPVAPPREGPREARLVHDGGDELLIETRGAGGYLVVSDPELPGWQAELDGRPVETFRADLAFRALTLPQGDHLVRMRYRPW